MPSAEPAVSRRELRVIPLRPRGLIYHISLSHPLELGGEKDLERAGKDAELP